MALRVLRFFTAGESHGKGILAFLEGLPANLEVDETFVNAELARRQRGYGRGGRMKIEKDEAEFLSGVRFGRTLGSPVTIWVRNRDWENWREKMAPFGERPPSAVPFTRPRPGHADLAGGLKYGQRDLRNVLERSSARETAGRVAAGALAKLFLREFGIKVGSFVTGVGEVELEPPPEVFADGKALLELHERAERSLFRTPYPERDEELVKLVDEAKSEGESLGGRFVVFAVGVPPGLGSHVQWDRRIDARLSFVLTSIQAVKGVEVGQAFGSSYRKGSQVHDEIGWSGERGFFRYSNNLGGTEGGITNGMPLYARCAMKPIPTLAKPLRSVDLETKEEVRAGKERTDVLAVPAASVVAEAMTALLVADALLEKLGGDFMEELKERYRLYLEHLSAF
ncbi:MAG: chorismate synthase [Aquificae bacterium]|nr:chorismate synthase [Aquificota bacterium]